MTWTVYLSGEIHTDWREQIIAGAAEFDLPGRIHIRSHRSRGQRRGRRYARAGVKRLLARSQSHPRSTPSARARCWQNAISPWSAFGDQYKQWNAAFDAGYCAALGKPYITLHDDNIVHPLKEVDAAAMAWAQTPAQVVQILCYVTAK